MIELKKEFLLETSKVVLGKENEFTLALCAFLSSGHILIEDVPGVGKTTFAKTLAKTLGLSFSRIQFTSDLMPSDIVGSQIYNREEHKFTLFKGPLFNQFILADELNRASPKTQSAMLEAMEERQISIDKETCALPEPFFVVATQNPNTQIGTHLLPESQLDRFIISLRLGYPETNDEKQLILGHNSSSKLEKLNQVINEHSIKELKIQAIKIKLSSAIVDYIYSIISYTRNSNSLNSLSPRTGIDIAKMTKAHAFLCGRDYALPDDVKSILTATISHRVSNSGNDAVKEILKNVPVD